MVLKKQKKVTKYRGSKTHGGGSMKKRRGAGNRGGRGNAGSGIKGDAKKPRYQKANKNYFGKKGFTSKSRKKIVAINLDKLQDIINKKGLKGEVNIIGLGYTKLLGTGKVFAKLDIKADYASKLAIKKIELSGGKIKVLNTPSEEVNNANNSIESKEVDKK